LISGNSDYLASDDSTRAALALEAIQCLSRELELFVTSTPCPGSVVPGISIDGLSDMQSSLLSAKFHSLKSSEYREWMRLAAEAPLLLDPKARLSLFRKACGIEDSESSKKDRVNGVERCRILEWAAAIIAAQQHRARHHPLAIQVEKQCLFPPLQFLRWLATGS
jgi:hypothetical protein